MTESVTPKHERLVDPETGETPPLSPKKPLDPATGAKVIALAVSLAAALAPKEPDDAA